MHAFWRFSLLLCGVAANSLLAPDSFAGPQTKSQSPPAGKTSVTAMSATKSVDVTSPYGSHLKPILDRIKATDDQRAKISHIVEGYRSRIQPLRDEYKQKRNEFLTAMTSGGTAETIMTKQVELSHLSSEISSRYCLMRLEVRRLLTPQQILQFEAYARENGWNSGQ
jgi:Spy/CpxP family protein refolding chaperone